MPLQLANLIANRASATVDFGNGNVLTVEYLPAAITGEILASLSTLGKPDTLSEDAAVSALDGVTAHLVALLASWDLVDTNEETLAIDEPTLKALGLMNQWTILNAILAAQGNAGKS